MNTTIDNNNDSRNVIENIFDPFRRFLEIEASGGILLLFFTVIGIVSAD